MQNQEHPSVSEQWRKKRKSERRSLAVQTIGVTALAGLLIFLVWGSEDPRYGQAGKWAGMALAVALLFAYAAVAAVRVYRRGRRAAKRRHR